MKHCRRFSSLSINEKQAFNDTIFVSDCINKYLNWKLSYSYLYSPNNVKYISTQRVVGFKIKHSIESDKSFRFPRSSLY